MIQQEIQELKNRLEWGQPALTIVDVRDRHTYHHGHIMGAVPIPMNDLVNRAKTCLNLHRDIYVYGESDEQTSLAARLLQAAGFDRVCEIKGGLNAWKNVGGATEGLGG